MGNISTLVLCDCAGTMQIDPDSAKRAVGADVVKTCSLLCADDIDIAAKALEAGGTALFACEQEAGRFSELLDELDSDTQLITADIRDRAGWGTGKPAFAKQAALLAEAALDRPSTPVMDITSPGTILVLGDGDGEAAMTAAKRLSATMAVTCLVENLPETAMAPAADFDLTLGKVRGAAGSLGSFEVRVEGFQAGTPAGRGIPAFTSPVEKATSECDVILDLRGRSQPLFPAPHKRDGYLRADPASPAAVETATFDAAQFQGVFEKPIYANFDPLLCAHSRAGQNGCSRCLDICPTGAITTDGDHVSIDPGICAGCGGCAAVCPSGAVSYDDPPVSFLFSRLRTLATTFAENGGAAPRALFHDAEFGAELISLSARHGEGLPSDVIPVSVPNVEGVGHAEILCALATGFAGVCVLASPRTDMAGLLVQVELTRAMLTGTGQEPDAIRVIEPGDPEALEAAIGAGQPLVSATHPILPLGGRREVARMAAAALAGDATPEFPLPEGSPYGAVEINTDTCTLCLSCVSLCPTGALSDNPDKPEVSFQETACLQCGICTSTCPENAISLAPRMNLSPAAMASSVLHQEEPFECISCGAPFGVRSTIERIIEKLEGNHPLFTGSHNADLIRMCDDCRVKAQYHSANSPFAGGEKPAVRMTEDYLSKGKRPT